MVSSAPPKLRGDLTLRQQRNAGGTFFVIKDPVNGTFFRLREAEGFVVRQFDGETPLDVVRGRVREQFGAELTPETLQRFAASLDKSGLLETEATAARRAAAKEAPRLGGSLLYLRYRLLNPTRIFDRIEPWIGFFFTPYFLVAAALLILLAGGVAVANAVTMVRDLAGLLTPSVAVLFIVISCLTVSLHEFAHGLTCRRFGGEVREMGFLLIYFQPAFYCNVSDAWLFPEKSKRLWVGFAGPFFELFLWALAVLVWRITEGDSFIHVAALIVALSSGIKTLFNFNPFIKLDGYYLLSDLLEIPNLRKKSFRYAGAVLRRVAGLEYEMPKTASSRERWIYLAYGLIASCTSIALMCFVLMKAVGYFLGGGAAAIPAVGVMVFTSLRLRSWIVRLFGRSSRGTPTDDDEEAEETQSSSSCSSSTRPAIEGRKDSKKRGIRWGRWVRRLA